MNKIRSSVEVWIDVSIFFSTKNEELDKKCKYNQVNVKPLVLLMLRYKAYFKHMKYKANLKWKNEMRCTFFKKGIRERYTIIHVFYKYKINCPFVKYILFTKPGYEKKKIMHWTWVKSQNNKKILILIFSNRNNEWPWQSQYSLHKIGARYNSHFCFFFT